MVLTGEQKRAIEFLFGPGRQSTLQVIAAAGSGKTRIMVEAIKKATRYSKPGRICVITFSRKAAHEMRQRLAGIADDLYFCGTMHALAYRLVPCRFKITTRRDQLLKSICDELFTQYSFAPAEIILSRGFLTSEEEKLLFSKYQLYKEKHGLKDFDDLLIDATLSLQQKTTVAPQLDILFVDELQDTSLQQVKFIQQLKPGKVFAVGDDWQSIYKFRGADVSISRGFAQYFAPAKRMFLSTNFRSQRRIVKLGNKIIAISSDYIKKKVKSHQASGRKPQLLLFEKELAYYEAHRVFLKWYSENFGREELTFLVRTNNIRNTLLKQSRAVLTIHSAKGLEFDHVCVFGVNHNVIPHAQADFNEEVRLLYVAATRARHSVFFTAWPVAGKYSAFIDQLARYCKVNYLESR